MDSLFYLTYSLSLSYFLLSVEKRLCHIFLSVLKSGSREEIVVVVVVLTAVIPEHEKSRKEAAIRKSILA